MPFRYQGQYEDKETGLYYNRFRYYSAEEGLYLSQDPIGLAGGNPTIYSYVHDSNTYLDVLGLDCKKFDKIIEGKNFKDHFIRHKSLIEELTEKKYKFKTDKQEFLNDIKNLIDDGILNHVGQGT